MGCKPSKSQIGNVVATGTKSLRSSLVKKNQKDEVQIAIPEDYQDNDSLFGTHSVVIWRRICSFMKHSDILDQLTFLNRGYNEGLIYRTFIHLKLSTTLNKEKAKLYMDWVKVKFWFCGELDANGFKYKKLSNFLIFKLPKLTKIACRLNTALLVKILPERSNITYIETSLVGMTHYADMVKFSSLKHLVLTENDENTPVQKILMQCPNIHTLELHSGWARNFPTLTHHKLEIIKAGHSESGSNFIDFVSKMANNLDDYLPNLKELHHLTGNSMVASKSLEFVNCSFYRQLNELIEKCPGLKIIQAYSASLDGDRGEFGNLEEIQFNKVKVDNLGALFRKLENVREVSIRNTRLDKYPLSDRTQVMECSKLYKLHVEVEHTYPSEDLSMLISGFPHLRELTIRYIPRKKLTYDEVLRVMEVKQIVLETTTSNLGRLILIEGYHREYPIYYEVRMKETFLKCKGLKTIALVTLPARRKKLKRTYFSRVDWENHDSVWVCERKVHTKRPEKHLKRADESKQKAEDARKEKEKQEQLTIAQKMNVMEENKETIEEDSIMRKAEEIMKKKESEINEFDEEILEQADTILHRRKENMARMHKRMKKKREKRADSLPAEVKSASKENAQTDQKPVEIEISVSESETMERKSNELDLSMFGHELSKSGQDLHDGFGVILESPAISRDTSLEDLHLAEDEDLQKPKSIPTPASDGDFGGIMGHLKDIKQSHAHWGFLKNTTDSITGEEKQTDADVEENVENVESAEIVENLEDQTKEESENFEEVRSENELE